MEEMSFLEGRGELVGMVFVLLVCTLLVYKLVLSTNPKKRLPPGPRGLPILGSMLSLSDLPHHFFIKLAAQYGPIIFMHVGSVPTVVISSPAGAKEILKTNDQIWASRPNQLAFEYLTYGRKDIALAPYGPGWRQARKICTLQLFTHPQITGFQVVRQREYMLGLQSIMESFQEGRAVDMQSMLASLFWNLVTQMMWKKRYFIHRSSEHNAFQEMILETFALLSVINISDYIPSLKPLMSWDFQGYQKRMRAVHTKFDNFIDTVIQERTEESDSKSGDESQGNSVEDFLDVLLRISREAESNGEKELDSEMLKGILLDMVIGSAGTTSGSTEWILAELIRHPKVMRKLQDELDSVVGANRLVNESDIPKLKYLQAVVKEGLRLHPPSPVLIPHESTHDSVISGYFLPAGTTAFVNVYAIHRDSSVWERPLEFDPDRFLSSDTDMSARDFEWLPFGSGRRMCAAMNLGLLITQSTIASLTHAFSWSLRNGEKAEDLDMTEHLGISCPKKFPLILVPTPRLPTHVICPEV